MDLYAPLSDVLRLGTIEAHKNAEYSQGAAWLTKGELDRMEYVRFLMMFYQIYGALEEGLDKNSDHSVLRPTMNPLILARTSHIAQDISHLLGPKYTMAWQSHSMYRDMLTNPPASLTEYLTRLRVLSDTAPELLLAHAYVRYLGDLSGGQIIRRRIIKAYDLEADDGRGTHFYSFKDPFTERGDSASDHKALKEWFRNGMNAGAGDDVHLKGRLLQEAKAAFRYNNDIFNLLKGPEEAQEVRTVIESPGKPQLSTSTMMIIAIVLVLGLIQLTVTIGGFMISKGYEKFLYLLPWFSGIS